MASSLGLYGKQAFDGEVSAMLRLSLEQLAELKAKGKVRTHFMGDGRERRHDAEKPSPKPRAPRPKSTGEELLMQQIRAAKLPIPMREALLVPGRQYRWDFAYLAQKIAIEVQGGIWGKGAHSGGTGIERDCEKANLAALQGFRTLFFTTSTVRNGKALETLKRALKPV